MTDVDLDAVLDRLVDMLADRVAARLGARNGDDNGHAPTDRADRLLTADEAARRLGVRRRWMYGAHVPFRVRLPGSRAARFSERGLERYISRCQGR